MKNGMHYQMKSDCSKCSGLCCNALFFAKADGFPHDKAAGNPCTKLLTDYRCKIHSQLKELKMKGCIGYDCFGAGQQVTQVIYHEKTWQDLPKKAPEIFKVFNTVFQLYQMRHFLTEALCVESVKMLENDIKSLLIENGKVCNDTPENILAFDLEKYRDKVNVLLKQVCKALCLGVGAGDKRGLSIFFGKNFSGKDMSGLDLSSKLLIAADFDGCIFNNTIFLGADTRDTNFCNADLRGAVFLTQMQINSAKGNYRTQIPSHLDYPITWA